MSKGDWRFSEKPIMNNLIRIDLVTYQSRGVIGHAFMINFICSLPVLEPTTTEGMTRTKPRRKAWTLTSRTKIPYFTKS